MTVGRLRQLVGRTGRRMGPVLVTALAVTTAGLGFHAAIDWHRHGEPGTGFFHLHVHFGDHEHPDDPRAGAAVAASEHGPGHNQGVVHSHDHGIGSGHHHHHAVGDERPRTAESRHGVHDHDGDPSRSHRGDEAVDPDEPVPTDREVPRTRRHAGVLSLALGIAPAPNTAMVVGPALEVGERAFTAARRLADRPSERRAWHPRGPPA